MPRRQPFTSLCQRLAPGRWRSRADLHAHTTASDGLYDPAELVQIAARSNLAALAITDHDTIDGVAPALAAAAKLEVPLEIVPGVEVTTELDGKEWHILGLWVDVESPVLLHALDSLRRGREARFTAMVDKLRQAGLTIPTEKLPASSDPGTVGRRVLAELLVDLGHVSSIRQAFTRYLGDSGRAFVESVRLPAEEAIAAIHSAGGIASWAHPPCHDNAQRTLCTLASLGLDAVEAEFPGARTAHRRTLKEWAAKLALATTAGSDCHGPGQPRRAVGACTLTDAEFAGLKTRIVSAAMATKA